VPANVLHPVRVFGEGPHDGILFFKPSIKYFDSSVCEAGCKCRRRPLICHDSGDRTIRIRVQVLVKNTHHQHGRSGDAINPGITKSCDSVWASQMRMTRESPPARSIPPDCFQSRINPLPCLTWIRSFKTRKELTICKGPCSKEGS
jgi:hypothetical protein